MERFVSKSFGEICDDGGTIFYWNDRYYIVLAEPVYYGDAVSLKDGSFQRFDYSDKVSVFV